MRATAIAWWPRSAPAFVARAGVDASTAGVFVDMRRGVLWACAVHLNFQTPTALRAFDLRTGTLRASYELPDRGICADIAVAHGDVYITDTTDPTAATPLPGRILRLTTRTRPRPRGARRDPHARPCSTSGDRTGGRPSHARELGRRERKRMTNHRTGTREDWLAPRVELLEAEKELTRRSDELARRRQELPWVPIEKEYVFETDSGKKTLAELFDGRSQLLVYHFMFGFGFRVDEQNPGCTGCSLVADHFDGVIPHLNGHDVTLVAESIAPLEELHPYKERMAWRFPWVSSRGSDSSTTSLPPSPRSSRGTVPNTTSATWTSPCRSARG
jgi:hypothetical protein